MINVIWLAVLTIAFVAFIVKIVSALNDIRGDLEEIQELMASNRDMIHDNRKRIDSEHKLVMNGMSNLVDKMNDTNIHVNDTTKRIKKLEEEDSYYKNLVYLTLERDIRPRLLFLEEFAHIVNVKDYINYSEPGWWTSKGQEEEEHDE